MLTSQFHFELPEGLIAQVPAQERDSSRLLVVHRTSETIEHRSFRDFPEFLCSGDLLIVNNSRVIPARLWAKKPEATGRIEILLLEETKKNNWWAMLRPAKKIPIGGKIQLLNRSSAASDIFATVLEKNDSGHRRLEFSGTEDIQHELEAFGEMPLPPYILRTSSPQPNDDRERYQTVYSKPTGSVAAPTAGLHFTPALLTRLKSSGVEVAEVTLHVGPGTFAPVKAMNVEEHQMHEERYVLPARTAALVNETKARGHRVIAVGTTSLRVLESVAADHGPTLKSTSGRTAIFVYPPREFKIVDALLTNFHLPESTLLMLVSAFAKPGSIDGRDLILRTYREAIEQKYRFFSYGDAMLIL